MPSARRSAAPKAAAPKAPKLGGGTVNLDAGAFTARFNMPLVHESVRAELAARRRGTASTKTRGQVRGGGEKPWRQKGTGRARAGSNRSPIWTGGGIVFGPSPRKYTFKINRKERRAALRSALSLHAERDSLAVFDAGAFDAPSTAQAVGLLNDWAPAEPVLIVLGEEEAAAGKSFRNLRRTEAIPVTARRRGRHRRGGVAARLRGRAPGAGRAGGRAHAGQGPGGRLMETTQVIIRPVISEKTFALAEVGKYTFRVHDNAHKTEIRQAIESLFEVKVQEIRTAWVKPKPKRRGYTSGQSRKWKKAMVQVAPGQTIPIFRGLEGGE